MSLSAYQLKQTPVTLFISLRKASNPRLLGVISVQLSSLYEVLKQDPSQFPIMLKPLYEVFDKTRNNWLLIKTIKMFQKLVPLEPRLTKKLSEPFYKLLTQTTSKTIEYELSYTVICHFREFPELFALAGGNTKKFLQNTDLNRTLNPPHFAPFRPVLTPFFSQ